MNCVLGPFFREVGGASLPKKEEVLPRFRSPAPHSLYSTVTPPSETALQEGSRFLFPLSFLPVHFYVLFSFFSPLLGGKGEIPGGTCPHSHLSPFPSLHTPNFAKRKEKPPSLLSCVSVE